MDLTKEQRITRHKDFLAANAETIAAFAWENYLAKGKAESRGAPTWTGMN